MKVIMLESKSTVEVNEGYGLRLIEQGKAIPVKEERVQEAETDKPAKKETRK